MANITITVPDDKVDRILNAFEYSPEKGTKVAFMKKELIDIIKSKVIMYEDANREPVELPEIDVSDLI